MMKTVVYHFSGTGNSLAVARGLAARLPDCEVRSIPKVMAQDPALDPVPAGAVIGIVAPIYMHGMPHMVDAFIGRITRPEYLFMVYAGGGDLGAGLARTQKRFSQAGLPLSALFNIRMPSNYTPFGCPSREEQARLVAEAERRIDAVADVVSRRAIHVDGSNTSWFAAHVHPGLLYRLGHGAIPGMDSGFAAAGTCTGCGVCARVCPAGNISLVDGRPEWHHRCEQCFGCLQWCPVQAIDYRGRTRGVDRYHHPDIRVADMQQSAPGAASD